MNRYSGVTVILCMLMIFSTCSICFSQDLPPKERQLDVDSYCEITVAMWQQNNNMVQDKIAAVDSLFQMPDEFYAAEQALNNRLQNWQDSVMASLNTTVEDFLKFGVKHKEKIEAFLQDSGMQQTLDSLQQANEALTTDYEARLDGYDLAGPDSQ